MRSGENEAGDRARSETSVRREDRMTPFGLVITVVCFGFGVFCLGLAVWFLRGRETSWAILWTIGGLVFLVAFAGVRRAMPGEFGPWEGKPDSKTSRRGFQRTLGYPPPPTVSQLRYWNAGAKADLAVMRFHCSDQGTIARIIARRELTRADEATHALSSPVEWWAGGPDAPYKLYARESPTGGTYLWVDEDRGLVFYQEWRETSH